MHKHLQIGNEILAKVSADRLWQVVQT